MFETKKYVFRLKSLPSCTNDILELLNYFEVLCTLCLFPNIILAEGSSGAHSGLEIHHENLFDLTQLTKGRARRL